MSLKNRLLYNLMYLLPGHPPWDTGITPPELIEYINLHPPGRALDLGCGTGTNAMSLACSGWEVTGIDFARRAIQSARKKARRAGIQIDFRVGDVARPGILGSFDLVLDIGCFHSLTRLDRKIYTQNLESLLAPCGTYLLYAFFRQAADNGPGLSEEDVHILAAQLYLVKRSDGTERGILPSAWLTFVKQP
jgi:cyclopropane fatty-acyl-phospholipid synthase-like methyltransferase